MDASLTWRLLLAALSLLLTACEPQRQPFAGLAPTATPTATPAAAAPLRYAIAASLAPYPLDLAPLRAVALVEVLTTEDTVGYDIVLSLRPQEGWQQAATALRVGWIVDPHALGAHRERLLPLLRDLIAALPVEAVVAGTPAELPASAARAMRDELLTMGYPDGIALVMAYGIAPGIAQVRDHLAAANLDPVLLPMADERQRDLLISRRSAALYWTAWTTDDTLRPWLEAIPEALVVASAEFPLYYRLAEGISISGYSPNGLPLIQRQP